MKSEEALQRRSDYKGAMSLDGSRATAVRERNGYVAGIKYDEN